MKISAVKSFAFTAGARSYLVVKVETDVGITGLGEAGLRSRERAVAGMLDHFGAFLVGQDPRRIDHLWQLMYRSQYMEGGNVTMAAAAAVDIALWDMLAKA